MKFEYCPHCGSKLIKKEIGDEGLIPYCKECKMPLFDLPTACTITLVVNEYNEAALIKQSYGEKKYVCVAGYMKIGERAEECAEREVEEELGLKPYEVEYVDSFAFDKKEMLMLGFLARVKKGEFKLSDEVECAEWFELDEAVEKLKDAFIALRLTKECIDKINV